ncbi:hypothetical protein PHYPSEUDO_000363 [Phytophthora pseudosyringae]|uniref:RxLR effector protein n=1 Tax=Phytophthora pseudosyringae TaxID=221518 RepID=A0A8T1W1B9_9STRA|nr:hypothetical protein PHYPSEUDO_000363 [Phytophthora pseudosyringae]
MKLLHHLLASAVCMAALVDTTASTASAQVVDPSYSGSGSDAAAPKFLRGPDDSEAATGPDESDVDSVLALGLEFEAVDIGLAVDVDESDGDSEQAPGPDESEEDSEFVNSDDPFVVEPEQTDPDELDTLSDTRRLTGPTEVDPPAKLAQKAATPAKPAKTTHKPATPKLATPKPATSKPVTTAKSPQASKPTRTHSPTTATPTETPTATPATESTETSAPAV